MSSAIQPWSPKIKLTTQKLMQHWIAENKLDQSGANSIIAQSTKIMSYCVPETDIVTKRTSLVVGKIQSGKTMSMIGLASLAKDNGYGVIIILAGTTSILVDQTDTRFRDVLRNTDSFCNTTFKPSQFHFYMNPNKGKSSEIKTHLRQSLKNWQSNPLCIVVMKNHSHLENLNTILKQTDVASVPTLIIDDEADQASLNTNPKDKELSTTFAKIQKLRNTIGGHTFIQYTATPYANLWIKITDQLSPDVGVVLTPGGAYTGLREYFKEKNADGIYRTPSVDKRLYRIIPQTEVNDYGSSNRKYPSKTPHTLEPALLSFLVAASSKFLQDVEKGVALSDITCSMMIHPHMTVEPQNKFYKWTKDLIDNYAKTLSKPSDLAYDELKAKLKEQYDDLAQTVALGKTGSLKPFEDLFRFIKVNALTQIKVYKINSTSGHEVKWEEGNFHILVGGYKLDRGFTIEGLLTTLMHRNTGNTADSLQQRARFFGYRKSYLGLCRIWLSKDVHDFYQQYYETEKDLHRLMKENEGKSLKEMKKMILLDPRWRPCRQNVLRGERITVNNTWVQNNPRTLTSSENTANQSIFESIIKNQVWEGIPEHSAHKISQMSLEDFWLHLGELNFGQGSENEKFNTYLWILDKLREDQEAGQTNLQGVKVNLYRMYGKTNFTRSRTVNSKGDVQIFQGYNNTYDGDKALRSSDQEGSDITCQIHHVEVTEPNSASLNKYYYFAIHIPKGYGTRYQVIRYE